MGNDIIVGLDIGTTKIVAIVGRKTEHGKIEILGYGKAPSIGVKRGVVTNIDRTVESIKAAVEEAQINSGVDIKEVYVGIAGQHIKSLQHHGVLMRENGEEIITIRDVDALTEDMFKLVMLPGEEIIHAIPQEFIIDYEKGIKEPIGMYGRRMEANFHIITGQIAAAKNIYKCIGRAGIDARQLILEPLASSDAVLSDAEKEMGVALVDIGGGTTDIAIFKDGIIRHTAVIALGGDIITEDIKEGCGIIKDQAEMLKIKFGSALASESKDNEIVSIPGLRGREPKEISMKNLAHIIQARAEDIIEHVHFEIKNSGFSSKNLLEGLVVTGGGAKLKHIKQLIEYMTGMPTRIGYPNEHLAGSNQEIESPMYATSVGLVIRGIANEEATKQKNQETAKGGKKTTPYKPKSIFDGFFSKGKAFFDMDNDDKNI
ncbi:MAG: cell division protein FtsA [Flavobacteriales bacterium]